MFVRGTWGQQCGYPGVYSTLLTLQREPLETALICSGSLLGITFLPT